MTEIDTIKQIAEDCFLTASNCLTYDFAEEDEMYGEDAELSSYRMAEVILNLGERLLATAGISVDEAWIPDSIRHMIDGLDAAPPPPRPPELRNGPLPGR